jgi:hypothetical protein
MICKFPGLGHHIHPIYISIWGCNQLAYRSYSFRSVLGGLGSACPSNQCLVVATLTEFISQLMLLLSSNHGYTPQKMMVEITTIPKKNFKNNSSSAPPMTPISGHGFPRPALRCFLPPPFGVSSRPQDLLRIRHIQSGGGHRGAHLGLMTWGSP